MGQYLCYILWMPAVNERMRADTVYMIIELTIEQGIRGEDLTEFKGFGEDIIERERALAES